MWFIVSKKKHHQVLDEWGSMERNLRNEIESLGGTVAEQQGNITTKDRMLKSTEREKVLVDLQSALNMIQDYQRALAVMSASDPQIIQANTLLEKYGMQGETSASYLGFQQGRYLQDKLPEQTEVVDLGNAIPPKETLEERIEREEKIWGEESYGTGNVRIEVEAIDEGNDKEEGTTLGRISFYDADDPNDVREAPFTSDSLGI